MKIYNLWLFRFVLSAGILFKYWGGGALIILIEGSFLSPFKRISGAVCYSCTFSLSYLFDTTFFSWYIYWLFETWRHL